MSEYSRSQIESDVIERASKDDSFRAEFIEDAKGVLAREYGVTLDDNVNVEILEESTDTVYMVLPAFEDANAELSDEDLEAVAGGWCCVTGCGGTCGGSCGKTSAAIEAPK